MADLLPDATTMVEEGRQQVAVVAVPFPAQGHLNPMLHLSLQLASRGLPLHYAAPAAQLRQARARVQGWGDGALFSAVQFHELGISEHASPAPPDPSSSAAAATPFPLHLMPLLEAYTASARAPLAALLAGLSATHRRVVVVHDYFCAFAAEEAARLPGGDGVAFELSCLTLSILAADTDAGLRLLRDRGLASLSIRDSTPPEFFEYVVKRARPSREISLGAGILVNTCRALDGELVDVVSDHLAAHGGKKLFAVGPLNPLLPIGGGGGAPAAKRPSKKHECLDWLDEQPPSSVLYVAFGTTATLRKEQVAELAAALRDSKQRFIWVLRDSDRGDVCAAEDDNGESSSSGSSSRRRHAALLAEFTEQTRGRGVVITGWAPQLEILAHGATAAFMNHCGWNSTIESLSHGKPILAWPMHGDHPWDADLVCKHLRAGILVRPWEKHGHDELVPAAVLGRVIHDAMLSDQGMAVRRRAMLIRDAIRAGSSSSSSSDGLDGFIAHITTTRSLHIARI